MQLQKASRKQAHFKMALQGPSGSGKTYSALLLAYGLVGDWSKIAVIDTENGSSNLYAHLGEFKVLELDPPHSPENYINAIKLCSRHVECIIVDSISHCWEFLLDFHAKLQGNSFANWAKVTPRQQAFLNEILLSKVHVICTIRTKQDYVLNERNGKMVPEKVGLKSIQRDGVDYDFTLVFDLDQKHHAKASKDRTGLFMDQPEYEYFMLNKEAGEKIKAWIGEGKPSRRDMILNCETIMELEELYNELKPWRSEHHDLFTYQKRLIKSKLVSNGKDS